MVSKYLSDHAYIPEKIIRYSNEITEKVKELADMGDEVINVLLSRIGDTDFNSHNFIIHALKTIDFPNKIDALKNIIEDETRTDQEKISAANLLQNLGYLQDFEYISTKLHNPQQMFLNAVESMINSLDKEEAVIQTFKSVLLMPNQARINLIENLKQFSDLRINRLFLPLLLYSTKEVQLDLLNHLKNYWSEEMLLPLRYLSEISDDEEVAKTARMAYFKTDMRIRNLPTDRISTKDLDPLYRCIVSNIDGDGGQIVSISRKKKSGKLKLFNTFFNDKTGIKDCLGVDSLNQSEYDNMFGNMLFSGVIFNRVSLDFAKECIVTGFELSLKHKTRIPEDFFVWHRHLYEDCELPQAEKDYQNLDLDQLAKNEKLYSESYNLLDLDEFESWFIEIPISKRRRIEFNEKMGL